MEKKIIQFDLFGNKNIVEKKVLLNEKFVVPPFSVLDTKQDYWLNRRRKWLNITGDLEVSREETLFNKNNKSEIAKRMTDIGTTSHFDPVLAEIIYKWFGLLGGKILDPFAGEQTKGIVAGFLGYEYHGVEFRQEQVDFNKIKCNEYEKVHYYWGDSNYLVNYIKDNDFDLCFTSPPYYDLEVYSDKDASAMDTYTKFMIFYKNVFKQCYDKLKDNRFLVVKVGEIRDKTTGEYRNFVGDTIQIMKDIGFKYYNELILLSAIGTLQLRVSNSMKTRKIGKAHQNILVFYKGDLAKIKTIFNMDDFENGL